MLACGFDKKAINPGLRGNKPKLTRISILGRNDKSVIHAEPVHLAFQGSKRYSRLTHFFSDLDRDGYRLLMAHVERRFDALGESIAQGLELERYSNNVRELTRQVVPDDDGSLIWSPARGGLTENPSEELARIYNRFIARHYEPEDKARRDEENERGDYSVI